MAMDFLSVAYVKMLNGRVDLGSSSATAIRCGDSNLASRKWLYIYNASNVPVYIGSSYMADSGGDYSSSGDPTTITAFELGKSGQKIASGDAIWLPVSDNITVYGKSHTGAGKRVRIMELA